MKYAEVLFTPAFKFSSSPWGLSGTIANKEGGCSGFLLHLLGGSTIFSMA
jgi:hypothetical protein